MEITQNINLFSIGIAITAIGILGFVIFFSNSRNATNRAFLFFALITILWSIFNYANYQITRPDLVLWLLRISMFVAVWHAFSFFLLCNIFPKNEVKFSHRFKYILIPVIIATSILTLTPYIFSGIAELSPAPGQVSKTVVEEGILVFGLVVMYLVTGGIFLLTRKTIKAIGVEKTQFQFVLIGTLITFSFLIAFNFILPAFFLNVSLIPLAPIFFLPFVIFTAYAIIKYRLLNIKVIATEVLTFVLTVVTLSEVLLAQDFGALLFRISIFILVLSFGILLIRSVRKEVEQREKLQSLTLQLENANEELKKLDKAKSEFVSIASHQLRTPLTAIKGYISMMLEGTYGKTAQVIRTPLKNVYDSNERLIKLVNDLLNLSRIESGRIKMEWQELDIHDVIQSIIEELQIKAQEKNLALVLQKTKQPLPKIPADLEKIRNAVLNVIDNAIRYTNQGRVTITTGVRTDPTNPVVVIKIQDTGAGMSAGEIGGLFKSFTRGSAGTKTWTSGAGLGLYIAKQFIQLHNGTIGVESEGKGKGSTFTIEFPVHQTVTNAPAQNSTAVNSQ